MLVSKVLWQREQHGGRINFIDVKTLTQEVTTEKVCWTSVAAIATEMLMQVIGQSAAIVTEMLNAGDRSAAIATEMLMLSLA